MKHHDREKSRSVDVEDNVVIEPPTSSKRIYMDSEDSDSDLENAEIDNEHENLSETDELEQAHIDALKAKQEFKKVIKKWWAWTPDWKKLFPEKTFPTVRNGQEWKFASQIHLRILSI